MNKISAVSGKQGTGRAKLSAINGKPEDEREKAPAAESRAEGRIPKDSVLISKPDGNWNDRTGEVLDRLREQYPSLDIVIDKGREGGELKGLAAGLGTGLHLVISQSFLDRMGSSTGEFARCSSVLTGIAKQLAGQKGNGGGPGTVMAAGAYIGESGASFWTAEKKAVKTGGASGKSVPASTEKNGKKEMSPYRQLSKAASGSVSRHYARLAKARTRGQVQSVMADVQRSMGDLRMMAMYGEEEEKVKAGRILRSLNKLLARGSRKVSRLNREQLVSARAERAEREKEELKAAQTRQERKRLRAGRSGSDYSLEKEGKADEAYIRGYKHYRQMKGDYGERALSPAGTVQAEVFQTDALYTGGMTGGAGEGIMAADVTVSGTISF